MSFSSMYVEAMVVFFNDTATTEIDTYGHTLSLHDALPISRCAVLIAVYQHRPDLRSYGAGGIRIVLVSLPDGQRFGQGLHIIRSGRPQHGERFQWFVICRIGGG